MGEKWKEGENTPCKKGTSQFLAERRLSAFSKREKIFGEITKKK